MSHCFWLSSSSCGRFGSRISSHTRIILGFSVFAFLMLSMPALDFLLACNSTVLSSDPSVQPPLAAAQNRKNAGFQTTPWPASPLSHSVGAAGMVATVVAVGASGVVDAWVQGSLFGMAGQLHEGLTQALVGGTSASGECTACRLPPRPPARLLLESCLIHPCLVTASPGAIRLQGPPQRSLPCALKAPPL